MPARRRDPLWPGVLLLAPRRLVIGFGLHNGGFFPDSTAIAALATLAALLVRVTLDPGSFAGQSKVAAIALAALALFAAWMLLSSAWSDSPSRAILEYGRCCSMPACGAVRVRRAVGAARADCSSSRWRSAARSSGHRARALAAAADVPCRRRVPALSAELADELLERNGARRRVRRRAVRPPRVLACATIPSYASSAPRRCRCSLRRSSSAGRAARSRPACRPRVVYLVAGPSRGMLTGLPVVAVAGAVAVLEAVSVSGLDAAVPTRRRTGHGHARRRWCSASSRCSRRCRAARC